MKKDYDLNELRPEEAQKQLASCFERVTYKHSRSEVFVDFVDYVLLMLNINKAPEDFHHLEKKYTTKEEHRMFFQMMELMAIASVDFQDALGDLFMDMVSHGQNGQFFTPQPICDMMSLMSIPDDDLEDGKSVLDCACGSGRMLLAAAKRNRNMKFYASDIDITCVKMTVINYVLNTMEGDVVQMDALSLKHYKTYCVRKILDTNTNYYLPYYYESAVNPFIVNKIVDSKKVIVQDPKEVKLPKMDRRGQLVLF